MSRERSSELAGLLNCSGNCLLREIQQEVVMNNVIINFTSTTDITNTPSPGTTLILVHTTNSWYPFLPHCREMLSPVCYYIILYTALCYNILLCYIDYHMLQHVARYWGALTVEIINLFNPKLSSVLLSADSTYLLFYLHIYLFIIDDRVKRLKLKYTMYNR